ncbi:MAG: type II toxin-antitoxin system prevent-host-death family antitoxin [Acidobacteria bacterium]|nr:type II toxin-antitoxin system prevent-host-death family antitoxin [Acidobacteriota bacterium]
MSSHRKRMSVGIKELKDRASEIIALVQRTGEAVWITKNREEVARIMPVPADDHERLVAAGLLLPGSKPLSLSDLKLTQLAPDASRAIEAILRDREEE